MQEAYAIFNEADFPIITVAFTGQKATDENFKAYLSGLFSAYNCREPFTFLFDATQATLPGFRYQKMQADWLSEHESLIKAYCRATAYVIPGALLRTVLKGIFALQAQPVPYRLFGGQEEAREWLKGHQGSSTS